LLPQLSQLTTPHPPQLSVSRPQSPLHQLPLSQLPTLPQLSTPTSQTPTCTPVLSPPLLLLLPPLSWLSSS
ncbi:hypothetical protein HDU99_009432, partial [Rhizoclosmatium hyalinum]